MRLLHLNEILFPWVAIPVLNELKKHKKLWCNESLQVERGGSS